MLTKVNLALVFALLIAGFLHPISAITQDLGRHLLTGEIILKTFSVPKTNLFSYTYPDFTFINHHWLSEVIFYLTYQIAGFNGLLIFTILIVTVAFALVFFFSLKQKGGIFAITIVSILYLRVLFERTDVRPEIFSFLFLSVFIMILYKYREHYTKWIFLLPFLELLWVNTHIYFPIGIAILGLFFIDLIIKHRKNLRSRYIGIFAVILLLSTFVTILNPNGISGALYPFRVFQNYGYAIEENQTVFFLWNYFGGKTTILYFFISVAALFSTLLLTLKKTRPIDWLLTIVFTGLAANAERNFPLFVFGTFIPFSRNLSIIFSFIKIKPLVITLLLLVFVLWQIKEVSQIRPIGLGIETGAKNAVDFFIANNLKGPVFNNFDIGSYLEYRLYPKEKVFIDGRPEAYPASFIQQIYIPMQIDQKLFDEQDKKYHFNTIFFSHTDMTPWAQTFLRQIVQHKDWHIVYLDDYVIILSRTTKEKTSRKSLQISNLDRANKNSLLRLANFFRIVDWQEHEEKMYQELLKIDPNSCIALSNLTNMLSSRNDPGAAVYTQKFQQFCN
ncbi:MAG: hypothetical protein HYV39_02320 [Candidatus Levybacteria bacterium]|nr:hypothetical protein [Candidatus Levybacteria bacterium]